MQASTRIGVISDTHGLLRAEAVAALQGCFAILHAGDVGRPEVLDELARIAPVTAVRGNVDEGPWAADLPERILARFGEVSFFMLHNLRELRRRDLAAGLQVVISGHSHVPNVEQRDGILYVNPGSAGPRRFQLPVSLALLHLDHGTPAAELVRLPSS